MRVLHVLSGFDHRSGGPISALAGLSQAQAKVGLQVTVAVAYYPDDENPEKTAQEWRSRGVRVQLIGPATGTLHGAPTLSADLRGLVAEHDIIHIHALWDEINHRAAVEAVRAQKPYLFRPCGQLDPWCLAQSRLKKQLYLAWRLRADLNRARALHFTSSTEATAREALKLTPPSIVESNGVDLTEFEHLPEPGSFRRRYARIGDRPLVVFLSRIHRKKGLDLLIPAFAAAGVADAVLVVAGPDDEGYRSTVEQAACSLGISDRVIFTGMLRGPDRISALADADLFVLPSYQENFGIAVVEALAAGTPVVISDQVQIHTEISRAQVGGVTPTQIAPLASEIGRWLTDKELRDRAGRAARPFVWATYNWADVAQRWAGHYQEFVRTPGRNGKAST